MSARERWIDRLRVLVAVTGVANAAVGLWAVISPRAWYDTFPGFGHHWVAAVGPYDEHLARDAGSGLLAVGVLLVWAAVAPRAQLLRPALVASLTFSVPHLGYHVASSDDLGTGDNVANLTLLSLAVVVPVALIWLASRGGEASPRGGVDVEGRRISLVPASEGGPLLRWAYRYSRRRYGTVLAPLLPLSHHPGLLRGTAAIELALQRANGVDWRLKDLAATRAAQVVGCEYCIDFGSALLQHDGAPEEQIAELPRWRESDLFSPLDRLVLEYAEALTRTPVEVPDELYAQLKEHFTDAQLVELTAAITFENHRARMNHAFGLGSHGFAGRGPAKAVSA